MSTTSVINGTPINGTPSMVMASSVLAAGWQIGGFVSGSGIPASPVISNISTDGLTVTLNKNATSSPGSTAITYGLWTHS
jgi:hypothetical protein